jgi:predicted ATPase/class 3 adenylate cyclase
MSQIPTGEITLLFTDIEGSTRLLQRLGDRYADVLEQHQRLLRSAFLRHNGHEFGTQGDAFFVAFESAHDAVASAVDCQRLLGTHSWIKDAAVRVRIGLHTGRPVRVPGDYVGIDVHRAARICSAAHGGQIVLSGPTADRLRENPLPDTHIEDLGEHRLKDLDHPERIFQAVASGLQHRFPPLRSVAPPSNLPAQPTSLVGREKEIVSVQSLLRRDDVRLITLSGPGGTGKTRLALCVASHAVADFSGGVFFVALAPLTDFNLLTSGIADALRIEEVAGEPIIESIEKYLADRHVLLVLDNFEHVLGAAPLVGRLLTACPRVKVIATSRTLLHVSGEHDFPVPALSLAKSGRHHTAESASSSEAVALFVDRARMARPGFALTDDNAPVIAEICVRLDGLPLAIELAAARSRVLSPEAILERLSHQLKLLTGGPGDRPERQKTIRGAIDWSYNLLDPAEKTVFRTVSVFAGGFDASAASEVAALADGDVEAEDLVESLTDKSLLRLDVSGDTTRFSMLRTIREYAAELLEKEGPRNANRHHAEYFVALAEAATGELTGPNQTRWLRRLETEHDNFRAALEWLLDVRDRSVDKVDAALRLAAALGRFWYMRGYFLEGSKWLESALAEDDRKKSPYRIAALHVLGILMDQRRIHSRAFALFEEELRLARAVQDDHRVALALNSLGAAARAQGDRSLAKELLHQSIALRRELGEFKETASSLTNLGSVAMDEGDVAEARRLLEQSLSIDTEYGDDWGIAVNLGNLCTVALEEGNLEEAHALFERAIELFLKVGDSDGLAECLEKAIGLASEVGDLVPAARLGGAVEAIRTLIGSPVAAVDQFRFERYLEKPRQQLSAAEYATARDEGRQMSLDDALKYARETLAVALRTTPSSSSKGGYAR